MTSPHWQSFIYTVKIDGIAVSRIRPMNDEQQLQYRFAQFRDRLNRFLIQLAREDRPAWIFTPEKREFRDRAAREQLIAVLERLEYPDDRDGRETDPCPGIVGASATTLELAASLNQARDAFKRAVLNLNRKRDPEAARRFMAQMGYPRLHFKQLYRHVPILLRKPDSIRFTWGATRSIKRISRQEAYQRLIKLAGNDPSPGYRKQLEALARLDRNEPIAIVQDLKPHIKANVCWVLGDGEAKRVERRMISAALAILLPLDPGEALPKHSAAYPDERKRRKARSDVKIEREPFLPSIRGHRYLRTG